MPDSIFNMEVHIVGATRLSGYPIAFTSAYHFCDAFIGDVPCIIAEATGDVRPLQVSKMVERIQAGENRPCLFVSPRLSAYQRRCLSERGVAWLAGPDIFHIPFLAASCSPLRHQATQESSLSFGAQQIAIHILDASWDGLTTTQIAETMNKSLASVSSYIAELYAIEPSVVGRRGRTRYLIAPSDPSRRHALFERLERHFVSPTKRRLFLMLDDAGMGIFRSLTLSGISALSRRTMLADDPWETRAVAANDKDTIGRLIACAELVTRHDEPDVLLEIWQYEPSENDTVSLYLSLREYAESQHDERLDAAIEELKGQMLS